VDTTPADTADETTPADDADTTETEPAGTTQ